MNIRHKYMLFCAIVFILAPIIMSTLSSDNITATDWVYRHAPWIGRYLDGDLTPAIEYPPVFHMLMSPFVALNFPMKYFQIIFAVLSVFGILYYTSNKESEDFTLYTAICLATSIAFVEFSSALMPQSLDYFIFPLVLLAYFKGNYKTVIAGCLLLFGTHIIGILFILILLFHSMITKRYKFTKIMLALLLIALPFAFYYNYFAPNMNYFIWDLQSQNMWENRYLNPIWNFFGMSGFLTWILLIYGLYKLNAKKFKLTETELLYSIWILAFFSFAFMGLGIWRMISYQIVPMTLLAVSLVTKK